MRLRLSKPMAADEITEVTTVVSEWASQNPLVRKVSLYGSRVKGCYKSDSDLDIAVEIDKGLGDENKLATWITDGDKWKAELQTLLPYRVHLEWYDEEETERVRRAVESSGILVYSKR